MNKGSSCAHGTALPACRLPTALPVVQAGARVLVVRQRDLQPKELLRRAGSHPTPHAHGHVECGRLRLGQLNPLFGHTPPSDAATGQPSLCSGCRWSPGPQTCGSMEGPQMSGRIRLASCSFLSDRSLPAAQKRPTAAAAAAKRSQPLTWPPQCSAQSARPGAPAAERLNKKVQAANSLA